MKAFLVAALVALLPGVAFGAEPRLGLPIACEIGKTCWVQQYFDRDPTSEVADYQCGRETYDGHDGIDIRLRDIRQSADVTASAAGTVLGVRDGVADRLVRSDSDSDRDAVTGIDCGNGVVIDHGDGWQTQYCHLAQGSLVVTKGGQAAAGQKLGKVGYSGMAAFPHVHLTVRHNGTAVDPFRRSAPDAGSCGGLADPLWTEDALKALAYRQSEVIGFGFAPGPVNITDLEDGALGGQEPQANWPALVAYGWAINLLAGDSVTVTLKGPDGIAASNTAAIERSKGHYMLFAGKKRPGQGWPRGGYAASLTIGPIDAPRLTQEWQFTLR